MLPSNYHSDTEMYIGEKQAMPDDKISFTTDFEMVLPPFFALLAIAVVIGVAAISVIEANHNVRHHGSTHTRNCTMVVAEIRKIKGLCMRLVGGPVACVAEEPRLLDPFNGECLTRASEIDEKGNRISCSVEEPTSREVAGYCKRLGRLQTCFAFDGTVMDAYNRDCQHKKQ